MTHTYLVKSYDEGALRQVLTGAFPFDEHGKFKVEKGKLSIPVKSESTTGNKAHWVYVVMAEEKRAAYEALSRRTKKKIANSYWSVSFFAELYKCKKDYAWSEHLFVLARPHVETVLVPKALASYWLEAADLRREAERIHDGTVSDSSLMASLLSEVRVAAEELCQAIETLDTRGVSVSKDRAPALHEAFQSSLGVVRERLKRLRDENDAGEAVWIETLTASAQSTAQNVRAIFGPIDTPIPSV